MAIHNISRSVDYERCDATEWPLLTAALRRNQDGARRLRRALHHRHADEMEAGGGDPHQRRQGSLTTTLQLVPDQVVNLARKKDHARADTTLLAWMRLATWGAYYRRMAASRSSFPHCPLYCSRMTARRFPPPWTVEEYRGISYIVRDANNFPVAYVYFESEHGRRAATNLTTKDEARKIANGIAKLPELLKLPQQT